MLAPPLKDKEGLILTKTNSIHMFFMNYEIDVIFLDKNNIVVDKIIAMKKRRVSKIYKNVTTVIELKARSLSEIDIKKGDEIIFEESDDE